MMVAAIPDAGFFFSDERDRLLCRRRVCDPSSADERVLQREALGTVDDVRGKILVAQPTTHSANCRLSDFVAGPRDVAVRPCCNRALIAYGPQPHASGKAGRRQRRLAQEPSSTFLRTMHAHDSAPPDARGETLRAVLPTLAPMNPRLIASPTRLVRP